MKTQCTLSLTGLKPSTSQVYGGVRLVPLLRDEVREDLRLGIQEPWHEDTPSVVLLDGRAGHPKTAYCAYIPHGLLLDWGTGVAQQGTSLGRSNDTKRLSRGRVQLHHRMAKRQAPTQLRFLPLHLALEGYMSLHFAGPSIMWSEYSKEVNSRGLSPRRERVHRGKDVRALEAALRVFEIHPAQCGVLVFVADAFATAFVVPRPEDYKRLHRTLVEDLFGDLLVRYSELPGQVRPNGVALAATQVSSLDDLERELELHSAAVATAELQWADGLFGREVATEEIYGVTDFKLERFRSDMQLHEENYIGERIMTNDGKLQYLKVLRLSDSQTRRAFLLQALADNDWNVEATAGALGSARDELIARLTNAGLGYLFARRVLDAAQLTKPNQRRR